MYLDCPVKFYYQYILDQQPAEDLLEELEAKEVGNFIHKLLEESFAKLIGKAWSITPGFHQSFFREFEKKFDAEFSKRLKSDAFMLRHIMRHRLERFIQSEKQRPVKGVLAVEKYFKKQIVLARKSLTFTCRVDRIDRLKDESILVIDYKTGSQDKVPKGLKSLEIMADDLSRQSIRQAIGSFQLPLYAYFIGREFADTKINAALYNLRDCQMSSFPKIKAEEKEKDFMELCFRALEFICREILAPEVPFARDKEGKQNCKFCPFFYLCR
jgi:hypothetical protein